MDKMQIVVEGTLPSDIIYMGECSSCGCVIKGPKKLWHVRHSQYDGETIQYLCPTIGCCTPIYGHQAPPASR